MVFSTTISTFQSLVFMNDDSERAKKRKMPFRFDQIEGASDEMKGARYANRPNYVIILPLMV